MHGRMLLAPTVLSAMLLAVGVAGEPDRAPDAVEVHDIEPAAEPAQPLTDADLSELERIRAAIGSPAGADAKSFRTALRQVAAPERVPPPIVGNPPADQAVIVTALRQSARHFDSVAATAEDRGEYRAADEARETANRLWIEARRVQE